MNAKAPYKWEYENINPFGTPLVVWRAWQDADDYSDRHGHRSKPYTREVEERYFKNFLIERYGARFANKVLKASEKKTSNPASSQKIYAKMQELAKAKRALEQAGNNRMADRIGQQIKALAVRHQKALNLPGVQRLKASNPRLKAQRKVTKMAKKAKNPSEKISAKIQGFPKDYGQLPFGRQLDYRHKLAEFKATAKRYHFDTKGISTAKGFAKFKALYQPTEWYFVDHTSPSWKDDSVEIWYKTADDRKNPSFKSVKSLAKKGFSKVKGFVKSLTPSGRRSTTAVKRLKASFEADPLAKTKGQILGMKAARKRAGVVQNPQTWVWPKKRGKKNLERINERWGILHDVGFGGGKTYKAVRIEDGKAISGTDTGSTVYSRKEALDFIKSHAKNPRLKARKTGAKRRNPGPAFEASSSAFETFHGKPSTKIVEVPESFRLHKDLWELGKLVEIKVRTFPTGPEKLQKLVTLTAPEPGSAKQILLTANAKCDQLYFTGGDQSVNLKALGFMQADVHDNTLIGEVHEITYRTKKDFDKFKTLDYFHGLGEVTKVKPVLTYDTRNKRLSLTGGQYKIKREGIIN